MNGCIYRTRSDLCMKFTTDKSISFCVGKKCPDRKESNADHIRSMTDEELAELLRDYQCKTCDFNGFCEETDKCKEVIFDWLKEESEGE